MAAVSSSWARMGTPPDMYVYHDDEIAPAGDLDFIAAARKYVPLLVAKVRRLRRQANT